MADYLNDLRKVNELNDGALEPLIRTVEKDRDAYRLFTSLVDIKIALRIVGCADNYGMSDKDTATAALYAAALRISGAISEIVNKTCGTYCIFVSDAASQIACIREN